MTKNGSGKYWKESELEGLIKMSTLLFNTF